MPPKSVFYRALLGFLWLYVAGTVILYGGELRIGLARVVVNGAINR